MATGRLAGQSDPGPSRPPRSDVPARLPATDRPRAAGPRGRRDRRRPHGRDEPPRRAGRPPGGLSPRSGASGAVQHSDAGAREAGAADPEGLSTEGPIRGVEVRDLRRPEAVVSYQLGGNRLRLAGTGVGRIVLQRGWRWQGHLGPWSARRRASRTSEAFVLAGRLGARDVRFPRKD